MVHGTEQCHFLRQVSDTLYQDIPYIVHVHVIYLIMILSTQPIYDLTHTTHHKVTFPMLS